MDSPRADKLRVLVADDEPTVLALYRRVLGADQDTSPTVSEVPEPATKLFGEGGAPTVAPLAFDVVTCGQGDLAVEAARRAIEQRRPFALAFLDVRMPPGMNGVSTAEHLRTLDPALHIVFVTAHSDVDPLEIARRVPPADKLLYIQKPFSAHEIRQCAHALTTKWSAENELRSMNAALETRVEARTAELIDANRRLRDEIEERERIEATLRFTQSSVDQTGDAIFWVGPAAEILYVNDASCRLLGYPRKELLSMTVLELELEHRTAGWEFPRAWQEYKRAGSTTLETACRTKAGIRVPLEMTVNYIEFDGTERMCAIARDITRRRRAEAELLRAMSNAEAASRAKSEFLANMSHEIRTPLTAILGFSDVLLDDAHGGEGQTELVEAARTVKRNGEYLLRIINDILDLSKIEAGKMAVERIECSPCEIVADVAALARVRAEAKGLQFDFDYVGPIPETIQTDPTRLRQILINLLGNAVKFTEVGGVRLLTELIDRVDGPVLQFDVVDTGIGLNAQQILKLFEPFTQADASTTRKFGGTGLGLAISKRLAHVLGGDVIVADTQSRVGTRFRVTVATGALDGVRMIADPRTDTAVDLDSSDSGTTPSREPLLGRRILLAEDGPDNQRLITHVLKKAGARVAVVENGKLAVSAAQAAREAGTPFDVILMDMQMPVMDGYEAVGSLRQQGYGGGIIALTAHAMSTDRDKCLAAGCDDYHTKPIDLNTLIAVIQRIVSASTGR